MILPWLPQSSPPAVRRWPRHIGRPPERGLTAGTLWVPIAGAWALCVAFILTRYGAQWGIAAGLAPVTLVGVTRHRGLGFALAVVLLFLIPYWHYRLWLIGPVLATAGLLAGVSRTRLRTPDIAVCLLLLALTLSWVTHPALEVSVKTFAERMLPFAFYGWARLTVSAGLLQRMLWVVLIAGGAAACTVLYEAVHGTAVFIDPEIYQWSATSTAIFRAGGIFGGSPTAATILAMTALLSGGLFRTNRRMVLVLVGVTTIAVGATFDRAGVIGLAIGIVIFALLMPYARWGRVALLVLAVSIPISVVATSPRTLYKLSTSKLVSEGVIRADNVTIRESLATAALPLLADSRTHFVFGRGFDALEAHGQQDAHLAAVPDLWVTHGGPNDDYLRALLEGGAVTLILMIAWLGGSACLGVRACNRLPPQSQDRLVVAGLTAAVCAYMVAATGHDFGHDIADLTAAALVTGMLVSACSVLADPQSCSPGLEALPLEGRNSTVRSEKAGTP